MDKAGADLAVYRLETARQCIISAKALIKISDYKGAANRSYYAVFHCMRSVLALCSIDFSKHSAVGAFFRKEYIKTGIFDVSMYLCPISYQKLLIFAVIAIIMTFL